MLGMFVIAILGATIGLIAYELYEEVSGSKHELHDRYHE